MATTRANARRSKNRNAAQGPNDVPRDVLRLIFGALAEALLEGGVTPQQIAEIAKDALVARASIDARMATGRINHSKVAAATGLSRSEVRRRLAGNVSASEIPLRALDRTSRVIAGWLRDPAFLRQNGSPKALRLSQARTGFPALVRRHSGDIPPRVVLEAMLSKGVAKLAAGKVTLLSNHVEKKRLTESALSEAAPYVAGLLGVASSTNSQLGFAHQLDLTAEDPSHEILLTEHVVRVLSAAIGAIESRKPTSRKRSRGSRTLRVTLTLLASPNSKAV